MSNFRRPPAPPRVVEHIRAFNDAVTRADFTDFAATFASSATMSFIVVPAGPFHGRNAIARGYAENPPDDTMSVRSWHREVDRDIVRFAWDGGGSGSLALTWDGDLVATLTVAFDPHELPPRD